MENSSGACGRVVGNLVDGGKKYMVWPMDGSGRL